MSDTEIDKEALEAAEALRNLIPQKSKRRNTKTPADRALRALNNLKDDLKNTQVFTTSIIGDMISFDTINLEDISVRDFLKESEDNLAFIQNKKAFVINRNNIPFKGNAFFECKEANGFLNQTVENIVQPKLMHLKKMGLHTGFISMNELKNKLISSDNIFVLKEIKNIQSVVNEEVVFDEDADVTSRDHCGVNPDIVYEISFGLKL